MNLRQIRTITIAVAGLLILLAFDYGGFPPASTAALAIAVWWAIALGLILGLVPRMRIPRGALAAAGLLIVLAALSALSIIWSEDAGISFSESIQASMIAGAFVLTLLLSKRGEGGAWLNGIAVGLFGIVFLALISRFFPGVGDDRELTAALGEIVGGRLSWPLGYWNAIGAMTAIYAVLATFLGGSSGSRIWRAMNTATLPAALLVFYLCSSRGALVAALAGIALLIALGPLRTQKLFSIAIGLAGGIGPVMVAARSTDLVNAQPTTQADEQGLVLLIVTIVATVITFLFRYLFDRPLGRLTIPYRLGWGVTGVVAVLLISGVILSDPVQRLENFTAVPTESPTISEDNAYATEHLLGDGGNGRWQLWVSAYRAAESEPITGAGAGGFADWFKQDGEIWFKTVDAHSTPLQILAELGLPGFLILFAFGLIAAWVGVSRLLRGPYTTRVGSDLPGTDSRGPDWGELPVWLAVLLTGLVAISIDWSLEFPVISIPLVIAAAMLCGSAYRVEPLPKDESRTTSLLLTALLVPIAGLVIVMAWKQNTAANAIEASRDAFRSGTSWQALKEAERAIDATSWAGEPYSQAAAVLAGTGREVLALEFAVEATRKSPRETSFWIQRARLESKLGRQDQALRSLDRAEETDPKAPIWVRREE